MTKTQIKARIKELDITINATLDEYHEAGEWDEADKYMKEGDEPVEQRELELELRGLINEKPD